MDQMKIPPLNGAFDPLTGDYAVAADGYHSMSKEQVAHIINIVEVAYPEAVQDAGVLREEFMLLSDDLGMDTHTDGAIISATPEAVRARVTDLLAKNAELEKQLDDVAARMRQKPSTSEVQSTRDERDLALAKNAALVEALKRIAGNGSDYPGCAHGHFDGENDHLYTCKTIARAALQNSGVVL